MAFADTTGRRVRPDINVTPLVDVVLVLLIIFMVVTPLMMKRFHVRVPEEVEGPPPDETAAPAVVLSVGRDGRIALNREPVDAAALAPRLRGLFAARKERVVFLAADDAVPYGSVVEVMDLARSGGSEPLVVLPEPLPAEAAP